MNKYSGPDDGRSGTEVRSRWVHWAGGHNALRHVRPAHRSVARGRLYPCPRRLPPGRCCVILNTTWSDAFALRVRPSRSAAQDTVFTGIPPHEGFFGDGRNGSDGLWSPAKRDCADAERLVPPGPHNREASIRSIGDPTPPGTSGLRRPSFHQYGEDPGELHFQGVDQGKTGFL